MVVTYTDTHVRLFNCVYISWLMLAVAVAVVTVPHFFSFSMYKFTFIGRHLACGWLFAVHDECLHTVHVFVYVSLEESAHISKIITIQWNE